MGTAELWEKIDVETTGCAGDGAGTDGETLNAAIGAAGAVDMSVERPEEEVATSVSVWTGASAGTETTGFGATEPIPRPERLILGPDLPAAFGSGCFSATASTVGKTATAGATVTGTDPIPGGMGIPFFFGPEVSGVFFIASMAASQSGELFVEAVVVPVSVDFGSELGNNVFRDPSELRFMSGMGWKMTIKR